MSGAVTSCYPNNCCQPSVTLPACFTLSGMTARRHTVGVINCLAAVKHNSGRRSAHQTNVLPTGLTSVLEQKERVYQKHGGRSNVVNEL